MLFRCFGASLLTLDLDDFTRFSVLVIPQQCLQFTKPFLGKLSSFLSQHHDIHGCPGLQVSIIQPPPSQMKRSRPVGYLHYRDNPLVEAILRQPPFCLKVEITEISKPFISNDWAGSLKPHRGKVSIARPQVAAATTKMKEILIL